MRRVPPVCGGLHRVRRNSCKVRTTLIGQMWAPPIIQLAEQASVDRRFANLLYVKIVQVLLHFAKVILDFTHRNQDTFFRVARTSSKVFSELECLYRVWESSYANLARLLHPTVSRATIDDS